MVIAASTTQADQLTAERAQLGADCALWQQEVAALSEDLGNTRRACAHAHAHTRASTRARAYTHPPRRR